jgi:translation initiation factor 1 (eIF-1/SUI1)
LKESFVADILPIITEATNGLAKIVAMFNWRTGDKSLADTLGKIDEEGTGAIVTMEQSEAQADSLIDKLASMGDYWTLDDNGKKTWDALAAELIELFPQLDTVINEDKNVIMNNTKAIKDNIAEWTKLEEKRILDENLAEKKKAIAEQYAAALDKEIEAEVKETEAAGKRKTAIEQINAALEENSVLSSVLRAKFGTDTVTAENANDMLAWLKENGYDTSELGAEAIDEWYALQSEADALREEAAKMTAEADAATESYNQYAEALARKLGITTSETDELTESIRVLKEELKTMPTTSIYVPSAVTGASRAIGDSYIPYDNFPALLHRGEKVLTATEARQSSSNDIDYTQLENRIISAIQSGMENATVNSYIDGQAVTDTVNRYNINAVKAKRFTT